MCFGPFASFPIHSEMMQTCMMYLTPLKCTIIIVETNDFLSICLIPGTFRTDPNGHGLITSLKYYYIVKITFLVKVSTYCTRYVLNSLYTYSEMFTSLHYHFTGCIIISMCSYFEKYLSFCIVYTLFN